MSQALFDKVKRFVEQNCLHYKVDKTTRGNTITIPFYPGKIKIFIDNMDVKDNHVLFYISNENRFSKYDYIAFDVINELFRLMNDINDMLI